MLILDLGVSDKHLSLLWTQSDYGRKNLSYNTPALVER
jgi:hypothetical protein